ELATSTIQKHYNVLNSIFKLAVRNETIKKIPMDKVDKPSVTYKPGEVYNSDELKQLFILLNNEENKQMVLMYKCQDKYVHFRLFKNVQFGSKNRYYLC